MVINVDFNVVGGPERYMRLESDHEWTKLEKDNILEIYHSNQNWTGNYKVLAVMKFEVVIKYSILLTRVELKHTKGGHNKRWIADVDDKNKFVMIQWGKIGGTLQSMVKTFPSVFEAAEFVHEKIGEKLQKGYNK